MRDARKELEALLLHINSASDRNIRLLQEQISQLKHASSEAELLCAKAEEKISLLYQELEKASSVKTVQDRLYPSSLPAAGPHEKQLVTVDSEHLSERDSLPPGKDEIEAPTALPLADTLNKSYSPVDSYKKEQLRFASEKEGDVEETAASSSEETSVSNIPEFVQAENPIEVQKPFKQQVMEMKAFGYTIEEIAHATGRSTQEVKITIEIS